MGANASISEAGVHFLQDGTLLTMCFRSGNEKTTIWKLDG